MLEALGLASSLISQDTLQSEGRAKTADVRVGSEKAGEAISISAPESTHNLWGPFCAFAQSELIFTLQRLMANELSLPTSARVFPLPLCKISDLGVLGFDCRDIHDGFILAERKTAYPAIWGHNASSLKTIQQYPNSWLNALVKPKKGRPLRSAKHLWTKSSRVLIAERLRLNTMRLSSILITEPVLSNVWWPLCLGSEFNHRDAAQKAIVLWINCSLGIILTLGTRVETEGAWIKLKKPLLESLPVLDIRQMQESQLLKLANAFDEFTQLEVKPFSEIGKDTTRAQIDQVVAEILGLPDFSILRKLLSREPILCLTTARLKA